MREEGGGAAAILPLGIVYSGDSGGGAEVARPSPSSDSQPKITRLLFSPPPRQCYPAEADAQPPPTVILSPPDERHSSGISRGPSCAW